jgi:hypothetical protein
VPDDDLKERLFQAWKDWDLEMEDFAKKRAAKDTVDALIDQYRQQSGSGASRTLAMFYLRDEYADWRISN